MGDGQAAPSKVQYHTKYVEIRRKFWEIRDMKGYRRYWRVTSMGYTGISRGMGNKGKSPSHLYTSFPTKSYHPLSPTRDRLHHTPMSHTELSRPQRNWVKEN